MSGRIYGPQFLTWRAVVHIKTTAYARQGFSLNPIEIPQGTGSGFIWDEKGYIVTNFHVVRNASRAKITLHDGTSRDAEPVGADPDNDLAVLKIRAAPGSLTPIAFATAAPSAKPIRASAIRSGSL